MVLPLVIRRNDELEESFESKFLIRAARRTGCECCLFRALIYQSSSRPCCSSIRPAIDIVNRYLGPNYSAGVYLRDHDGS
jgi:hypothetical protein